MPLIKPKFRPGVNRENTQYYTEGGWYQSDKIRFRQGMPEKIGGWTQFSTYTYLGVCRTLWNWITLSNSNLIAVGTNLKFYVTYGTLYYDITPVRSVVTLTNPFTATAGSSTITVTATAHGALINDFVTFSGATGLGGNITSTVLNQQYQITAVTSNTFTFTATATANSTDAAGSPGGGTVTATFQLNTGPAIQVPFNGWGASYWNTGTWGNGGSSKVSLQIWNAFNFGENLLYGPRGGGLYYWQPAVNTLANPGVNLNSLGGTVSITNSSTTGVPALVASTVALPNNSSIQFATTGALPTGLSTNTTYYVTNALATQFNVAISPGGTPISTSSNGSGIQSISILADVPFYQNALIVSDSSRFIIVFGTNNYQSNTLDPMLIRWSDQSNPYVWYPDITNQAGSQRLSHGSSIITVVQTRQEIVVLTDQAVYSMQYVGPPFVWGIQLLSENISIIGPNAAVLASGVVYWMGVDKFYMYDGRVQTLNCDLRRFVFQNLNAQQNQQVYCSTVEGFNEVWWFYCTGTNTNPDSYVVYNYLEKIWYYGTINRTAWLDTTLQPNPIGASYNPSTQTGALLNQESGVDDNSTGTPAPIDAYIQSSEFDISGGEHYAFVWRMLPDLTFTGSNTASTSPAATMTLYPLQNSGSGTGTGNIDTVNYLGTTYTVTDEFTGIVYTRIRGRQLIFKMESNKVGTTWQLGAVRFDVRPDGRR
jgi:hypothetical protein